MESKIVAFKDKEIRRILHNNEWWFAIVDVVAALTGSANPSGYVKDMRRRDKELSKGWGQIATPLSIKTAGGTQKVNCANTEGIFRIIQSIPSPKAEPFKRWLAKVGYERVQEIEDPELATKRTKAIYRAKGYSENWIEKRMRGIAIRAELTDEWKNRGVKEKPEYAILTSEISKAAFGLTPSEYKELKRLKRENLRDHMTDLELIFSMLGEAATTEIARSRDSQGFPENKAAAQKGGKIAGDARENLEQETGENVVSEENYLSESESRKRLKRTGKSS
ncbi:MAG: Bro-N domain-containing protein [Proteobacteria bacterium]|nr:Bro-N domain-containing protein [Pseudomonadota bacterium]